MSNTLKINFTNHTIIMDRTFAKLAQDTRSDRVAINGTYAIISPVIIGIVVIVFGCLMSWIGSFFAYGFGQLIENTDEIRKNTSR